MYQADRYPLMTPHSRWLMRRRGWRYATRPGPIPSRPTTFLRNIATPAWIAMIVTELHW